MTGLSVFNLFEVIGSCPPFQKHRVGGWVGPEPFCMQW